MNTYLIITDFNRSPSSHVHVELFCGLVDHWDIFGSLTTGNRTHRVRECWSALQEFRGNGTGSRWRTGYRRVSQVHEESSLVNDAGTLTTSLLPLVCVSGFSHHRRPVVLSSRSLSSGRPSDNMAEHKRQEIETASSPAKKIKLDNDARDDPRDSFDLPKNWQNFEVKRILNNNIVRKQIWLEGSFKGHESTAIVLLEKKIFPDEAVTLKNFFNEDATLKSVFDNDAYGSYECFPTREHNGLNTTVIYPATQKHLEKFAKKEINLVEETPELYKTVTIPKVIGEQFSLKWVENILDHKAEADRIIYEDTDEAKGFVLIPDLKWDGNVNTLNVLAISRKKINSIRELNDSHLPLLRNIKDAGTAAIVKKYDVPASRLRVFFHYLPSYYHLHVHFTQLSVEDAGIYTEKAHLLSTVISNIELMPDYYQKATLTFAVFNPDLVKAYKQPESPSKDAEPEEEC